MLEGSHLAVSPAVAKVFFLRTSADFGLRPLILRHVGTMLLEAAAVCLVGFVCSRHPRLRATWVIVAAAFLAAHLGEEAGAAGVARALVQNEVQRRQR